MTINALTKYTLFWHTYITIVNKIDLHVIHIYMHAKNTEVTTDVQEGVCIDSWIWIHVEFY